MLLKTNIMLAVGFTMASFMNSEGRPEGHTQPNTSKVDFTEAHEDKAEPIAIIDLDLKLPQDAAALEGFCEMRKNGRSALTEVPKDWYKLDAFHHPESDRAGIVRCHHCRRRSAWIYTNI